MKMFRFDPVNISEYLLSRSGEGDFEGWFIGCKSGDFPGSCDKYGCAEYDSFTPSRGPFECNQREDCYWIWNSSEMGMMRAERYVRIDETSVYKEHCGKTVIKTLTPKHKSMTLQEYQDAALRTAPPRVEKPVGTDIHDLLHGAMGVCTEGGELLDAMKKHEFYGKPIDWINVKEELGDIFWYLAIGCRAANISLEEVAETNIAKLKRRYPDRFTSAAAINRDISAERAVLEESIQERE
jgi:NTP pyrophosphatase (non-canonical NTP hydrolase)